MNKDEFHGSARELGGKIEKTVGDVVNNRDLQVDGVVDQVLGGAQHFYGRAKSVIGSVVDGAPEIAEKFTSDARVVGDRAFDAAKRGARSAQASAKEAPVLWVFGAAALGYGLAWLIYRQRD